MWRERVVPIRNLLFGSGSKSPEQLLMLSDLSLLLLVRISGLASAVRISSNVAQKLEFEQPALPMSMTSGRTGLA
jgi:hypothetical protein